MIEEPARTFAISLFDCVKDNAPKPQLRTWDQLLERIASPLVRAEKDGPLFSPAIFDPPKRGKKNVTEVSMLVLDYDHHANIEDDCAPWIDLELTFAVYSTHSSYQVTDSNPDAEERFRVMIPLLEPIPGDKFPLLWQWAAGLAEGKIDKSAKDSSRIFYTPAKCAPDAEYRCFVHQGELLDWRGLNLKEPERVSFSEMPKSTNGHHPASSDKWARAAFDQEVGRVAACQTARNDQLNRSAFALGQIVAGGALSEPEVEFALERAAIACGLDLDSKGGGMAGIRGTIASGLAAGKLEPRTAPEKPLATKSVRATVAPDTDEITQTEVSSNPPVLPLYWKRTDLGIAEEFVRRFGDRLRRVVDVALKDRDGFCWWSGTHWQTGSEALKQIWTRYFSLIDEARAQANKIWARVAEDRKSDKNAKPTPDEKSFIDFASSLESANRGANFLTMLGRTQSEELWIDVARFDQGLMLLNFENGTVDLSTGKLQPHNPDDYITRVIPFSFDPDADQALWLKFLGEVQTPERIAFLQRWAGYCATGAISEKKFLVALGVSQTGKSVFWNVLRAALGPYAQTASVETFQDDKRNAQAPSEDRADLAGGRLVVLPEPSENYKLSDAFIKLATGGEQIRARRMNQNGFVFTPQFKAVYYTNYSLRFNGADSGMQTRYCEVSFDHVVPVGKRDEGLTAKFMRLLPGVAAWIVEGARLWREGGLLTPDEVTATTKARLKDQDPVGTFLDEFYDQADQSKPEEMKWREPVKDLYNRYRRDCEDGGRTPLPRDRFSAKVDPDKFPSEKKGGNQYRLGLSLKEEYRHPILSDDAPPDIPPDNDEMHQFSF